MTITSAVSSPPSSDGSFNPSVDLHLACPRCRRELVAPISGSTSCASCRFVLREENGIWRALPEERLRYFQRFVSEYQAIREAEGHGSSNPADYLALPYLEMTGKLRWQWQIRGRSFRCLENRVWSALERQYPTGFDLLDIGAGNGWLCYRAALRGHRPVALDLLINERDGLGTAWHYFEHLPSPFPRFQAEMDRLPFADGQFDVVLFNASLHYTVDYSTTVREALRCLRAEGCLLVVDSPVYRKEESGLAMVREKHREFERKYGFPSNSITSREFLTFGLIDDLAVEFKLHWKFLWPRYGLKWAFRPTMAKLKGAREPSKFVILWGSRQRAAIPAT